MPQKVFRVLFPNLSWYFGSQEFSHSFPMDEERVCRFLLVLIFSIDFHDARIIDLLLVLFFFSTSLSR